MAKALFARLINGPARAVAHELSAGALFRRRPPFGPVEYAEIIDVAVDPVGIRHVRFRLVFGYRDKAVEAGERTLAVAAFTSRFGERIERPARAGGAADRPETGPQG
jgi:hypothetical protein